MTHIDGIHIPFHDNFLAVTTLELLRAENLKNLTLNRDAILLSQVFDQLLRDRGTTELRAAAKEHIYTSFGSCDPVNTLMLIKALIFNCNGRIDQILRNLLISGPLTVCGSINLLQFHNRAVSVLTVNERSLIQIITVKVHICVRNNILLQIGAYDSRKYKHTNDADKHYSCRSSHRNLKRGKHRFPRSMNNSQRQSRFPLLALQALTAGLALVFTHINIPPVSGQNGAQGESQCYWRAYMHTATHTIIAYPRAKRKPYFFNKPLTSCKYYAREAANHEKETDTIY